MSRGVKRFAAQRPANARRYVSDFFELPGSATLVLRAEPVTDGKFYINGVAMGVGEAGVFFKEVPLQVTAAAPPGFRFKHWVEQKTNQSAVVLPRGATWKYRDDGAALPGTWIDPAFDDASWLSGPAELVAVFEPVASHQLSSMITSDVLLRQAEAPYFVAGAVTVAAGATLTAEPGVVLLMSRQANLTVNGSVRFLGTADALPSGVYVLSLVARPEDGSAPFRTVRKMVLMK